MKEKIRSDIISTLKESIKAIKKNDLAFLREQSDTTIHNSSIYQDQSSISIAVIIYSLFKILEKKNYTQYKNWDIFKTNTLNNLKIAYESLEKGNIEIYYQSIKKIIADLNSIEDDTGLFIEHVIKSSKIKKAGNIFLHGVSTGRVAEILGISEWELMSYFAQRKESTETPFNISKSIAERLAYTKRIFNSR